MRSVLVACTLFIGITIGLPLKDNEIDELILRVNELRRQNPYPDRKFKIAKISGLDPIGGGILVRLVPKTGNSGKTTSGVSGGSESGAAIHRGKRAPVDLERNPLLYDYYAGVLSSGRKNIDEIDRRALERWLLKKAYENPNGGLIEIVEPSSMSRHGEPLVYTKRNFDEIDRSSIGGFSKRYPSRNFKDAEKKRNFDEIDQVGFTAFKRNFDEIDRVGFNTMKKNFDEIDRVGFNSYNKRSI